MYFSDRETPYPCLEIVDKKKNSRAKILTLKVHPPVIGAFLLVRKLLDTPLNLPGWSTTETKDIMGNFSDKVMTVEVPLLKSSTHQNVVIASSARRDESFSSWRVPPFGFGKEPHIEDNGKMSNSWSDFLIGLRSSFVTLRHDDDLIVEPYSPHRFSRQFGFCQDVPGVLIEQHYDGSLLAIVQLWDSCVRLGSSSKIIISMRQSNEGPLMTRIEKSPSVVPLCKEKSKPFVSPNGLGITSATSSSNESNVSQEQHWKHLKKKHKDLGDQHNEFVDLDSISIDTAIFGDGVAASTMPLTEYAQQRNSNRAVGRHNRGTSEDSFHRNPTDNSELV
ncbi:hypothetical protein K7X08_024861 [Anisodus acutangulus]|uniref:Uncharacterized protein n=1 Tax=Anisodus acutangulus TaxID=402998 RepID=A0A9Q1RGC5_9SOLA|nr:hypothetical protein K7X08_024861 [Anisodus acutangulus]